MTKDEFKNRLAAGLYDTYEAGDPNVLGVYSNSIEFGVDSIEPEFPLIFVNYTRQRRIGGNDVTAAVLHNLEELMELVCDD